MSWGTVELPEEPPSEEPDFEVTRLLDTGAIAVRHVRRTGTCRHRSAEECASATHLVSPCRGAYLVHVGGDESVADANHVLFFNAGEGYRASHPVPGSDASPVIALSEPLLRELTPPNLPHPRETPGFPRQSRGIDPAARAMMGAAASSPAARRRPAAGPRPGPDRRLRRRLRAGARAGLL